MTKRMKKISGIVLTAISVATLAIPSVYAGVENDFAYKFKVGSFKKMVIVIRKEIDKLLIQLIGGKSN